MEINMKNKNQLEGRIMRQVYFIWFSKRVLPYIILEGFVFTVSMYLISQNVFVAKVIQYAGLVLANQSEYPVTLASFAFDIFLRTRPIVQISILGSLIMFTLIFKNFIVSVVQFAHAKDETNLNARMLQEIRKVDFIKS